MTHLELTKNERAAIDSESIRSTAENIYFGAKDAVSYLGIGSITGFYMEIVVLRRDIFRLLPQISELPTHGKRLDKWKLKDLIEAMTRDLKHLLEITEHRHSLEDTKKTRKMAPALLRIQGWMMMLMKASSNDDACPRMKYLIADWKSNPALENFTQVEQRKPGRPRSLLPPRRKKRAKVSQSPRVPPVS